MPKIIGDIELPDVPVGDVFKDDGTFSPGSGGATDFTDLNDVPSSYSGESLKALRVNSGETALEFFTLSQYTDEQAQDAVGGILSDTGDIDFTYNDSTPEITAIIKNDSVTYAKIQNVSTASVLLGRGDSGSGDTQEITLGTGLSMSGTTLNATSSGGMTWTEVTGTTQSMAVDNGYGANNASRVVFTLPDTAAFGKIVAVQGIGTGGWRVGQNAGEQIIYDSGGVDGYDETTVGTGGYIESTDQYDSAEFMCIVANTTWVVRNPKGTLNLV